MIKLEDVNKLDGDLDEIGNFVYRRVYDWFMAHEIIQTSWYNNIAIYGNQWASWNIQARTYTNYLQVATDKRIRLMVNKIRPIMAARAAFITGDLNNVTIQIDSETENKSDKLAALTAQHIARAWWQEEQLGTRLMDTWEWTKMCSIAFAQIYYDPTAGRVIPGTNLHEGKIKYRIRSPFAVAYDSLANEWRDVRWVGCASVMLVEDAKLIYGENAIDWDDLRSMNVAAVPTTQEELKMLIHSPGRREQIEGDRNEKGAIKKVLCIEYWEKPTPKYKKGRYIVTINNKVVKYQDELELYDETTGEVTIPLIPFFEWKEAGCITGETPVTEMRALQECLNRVVSLTMERANMPDLYAFPKTGGWPTHLSNQSVLVGTYLPGTGGPLFVSGGYIRQDYMNLMRYFEEQMENIAGVSALSTRQKTIANMSGRLGYIVNESNQALLGTVTNEFKNSVVEIIRVYLRFVKKYYNEQRTASYINEFDRREIVRFSNADIGYNHNITIKLAEKTDTSPQAMQSLLQMFNNPAFGQMIMSNKSALKEFVMSINPKLSHKLFFANQDVGVAEDENFGFSQGEDCAVNWYDEDDTHIEEHKTILKSDEIMRWNPPFIQLLENHILAHEDQKQGKMRAQAYNMGYLQFLRTGGMAQGSQPSMPGAASVPNMQQPMPQGAPSANPLAPENLAQGIRGVDQNLEQSVMQNTPLGGA